MGVRDPQGLCLVFVTPQTSSMPQCVNSTLPEAITQYILKTSWEVLATPMTYRIVAFLKRKENEDFYDTHTNFTPFKVSV